MRAGLAAVALKEAVAELTALFDQLAEEEDRVLLSDVRWHVNEARDMLDLLRNRSSVNARGGVPLLHQPHAPPPADVGTSPPETEPPPTAA